MNSNVTNENLIKTAITYDNGLDLLHVWLEIVKQEFIRQSHESKDPGVIGPAVLSRDAITQFQEQSLPILRDALDFYETSRELDMQKIKDGELSISDEEKSIYKKEIEFCNFMLRGKNH